MSNTPQDQAVREQALIVDQSFIIQAPAGSGKTALLIKRYLRLLTLVEAPEEIIAITFTRKAAAEMQGRLLSVLTMAHQNKKATNQYEQELIALSEKVLKRDAERAWHLLENKQRLRIQTIDALCSTLTKQLPLLANLGSQPEIIENAIPLYELAAERTLAELEGNESWSDAIAALLIHLDNDLPRVKRLLVNMLIKRDQWLSYVLHEHDRQSMQATINHLAETQLQYIADKLPDTASEILCKLISFAATNLEQINPEHPIANSYLPGQFPAARAEHLSTWRAITELLLTTQGTWRKRLDKTIGFPSANEKGISADEQETRAEMKLVMQSLLKELQAYEGLQDAIAMIRIIPDGNYTDAEWLIVKALCDLLKLSAAQLDIVFAERNQMDFIGIANKAIVALGTDDSPTDLARHLDYQIKHLLIDEFQDVSVSQARLIRSLTREWSLDDGRTLFLVGDPMQSIYRFREAEVGIFIRAFNEQQFGHVPLIANNLTVNFRSEWALVEWFNTSFKAIFPADDDHTMGAVSYADSEASDNAKSNNNVTIYPIYERQFALEADKVCDLLIELTKNKPEESIAILVRGRSHLIDIVSTLRQTNINFRAIDIEQLAHRQVIQDLLALTRALLFPADRLAWLACLRAPWCGFSLESLHHLCHDNRDSLIIECLTDSYIMQGLNPEVRLRAENFLTKIKTAMANRERYGLSQTLQALWYQIGGPATLSNQADLNNSDTFFALLEKIETAGSVDKLENLLTEIEKLYAAPDELADQNIQIMTIHKAKGLEFDHVILPGLGRQTRNNPDDLLAWMLMEDAMDQGLVLAPIKQSGQPPSSIYNYINHIDKQKQRHEDLRLLYVASTRAKKSLHLFGHVKLKKDEQSIQCEPNKRSLLHYLWPSVEQVFLQHIPDSMEVDNTKVVHEPNQPNRRLANEWKMPDISSEIAETVDQNINQPNKTEIDFDWASETIKHIGSVTHRMIQHIAESDLDQWNSEKINQAKDIIHFLLIQLGVPADQQDFATKQVIQALVNMLNDDRGLWILSHEHKETENEYALSGLYQGSVVNIVLDRTFIDDKGIRWIIDYKTSRHEGDNQQAFLQREQERYTEQLTMYGEIMSHFDDRPIKLALYFPLLQGWQEWQYQA
ncbi:MAG: UvrD-helicase domain-containing protein [Pseudomonadota bacterium]